MNLTNIPFRSAFYTLTGILLAGGACVFWTSSMAACSSLSNTSPIPDGDASDLDGGYLPPEPDAGDGTDNSGDNSEPPPSSRVRLANFLVHGPAVDLCVRAGATGAWVAGEISANPDAPKPAGLAYGEVSAHFFLPVATPSSTGQPYSFRVVPVGQSCDEAGPPIASIAGTTGAGIGLTQGSGVTLVVYGVYGDASDAAPDSVPRGAAVFDNLTPPEDSTSFRAINAAPDLPPMDVKIATDQVLTAVKYGGAAQFPYSSSTGYVPLAGGIAQGSSLTIKGGTTARTFQVPQRVRRGVAMTLFVGGRVGGNPALIATLCSDRSPAAGAVVADCTPLTATQ